MKFIYQVDSQQYQVEVDKKAAAYRIKIGDKEYAVRVETTSSGELQLLVDGKAVRVDLAKQNGKLWVAIAGRSYVLERISRRAQSGASGADGGNLVCAPMPGQVRDVMVTAGEQVQRGQTLMLLEAMKMEMRILAPRDGKVVKLGVKIGQQVDKDDVLAEVE